MTIFSEPIEQPLVLSGYEVSSEYEVSICLIKIRKIKSILKLRQILPELKSINISHFIAHADFTIENLP